MLINIQFGSDKLSKTETNGNCGDTVFTYKN